MSRTLEQILESEKPAVVADAKAKAKAILDESENADGSTWGSVTSSPGGATKASPHDEGGMTTCPSRELTAGDDNSHS
jgi:hypothetical protein